MFGYRASYILLRPWLFFKELKRSIVSFFQRGFRGYSTADTWSLTDYLLEWLPDAIDELNKRKIGYPADVKENEWPKILNEMADGLRAAKRIIDCDFTRIELDELTAKADKGLDLFRKHFYDLWD